MRWPKSLKNKLILYVILVAIVPSIVIGLYYFVHEKRMHDEIVTQNAARDVAYILHNMEAQLGFAEQLSDWAFTSRALQKLLLARTVGTLEFTQSVMIFQNDLEDVLISSSIGKYVSSVLIIGSNGLDVRSGMDAALIDKSALAEEPWFDDLMNSMEKMVRRRVIPNPALIHADPCIIPFARPLRDLKTFKVIGWVFMGFKLGLLTDSFKGFTREPDASLFLVDSSGFIAYHTDPSLVGMSFSGVYPSVGTVSPEHAVVVSDRGRSLVLFQGGSDWLIGQEVSSLALGSRTRTLLFVCLLVLSVSLGFTAVLAVFLSSRLTRPLRRILDKMRGISSGDFSRAPLIEGSDELGLLGRGINTMAEDIRQLLDRLLSEEAQKRKLELSMLQYQINPHFLYNTLNTLRWMAILQKADGLRDAITALGRLLRNALGDTSQQITVREELAFLQDYVLIQKLRYKERFDVLYKVDSEPALDCLIPKLTLQPLVENAFFHGIERKKNAGLVTISVRAQPDAVQIDVEDDGAGMTEQEVKTVFASPRGGADGRGFSGIGIRNVDERIRLTYGARYGVSIESVPDRFTRVTVTIPGRSS